MHITRPSNSTIAIAVSMAGMLLNLALHSPALGTVAFTAWCIAATHRVASLFQPNSKLLSYFLSALICASTLTLGSLLVYFTLPLNAVSVGGLLTLLTFALLRLPNPQALSFAFPTFGNVPREIIAILVLFQSVILAFLIAARTSEPLVSPWTLLPGSIFVLFFVSTALTLYVQHRGTSTALLFAVVQLFLAVSVSAIVYGIGFGFDPFVHRAGETALITTGHIEPVSILYSGQYALVGALHFLTQLSVTFVDMWLLPLFASIFPPLAAYVGLRHGWNIDERVARFGWVATLFIPFMLFTFTVPFTVTYVFFAGALFLFPLAQTTKSAAILILAATTMCFFHPLLAVPTLLLFAASWLAHRLSLWVSVASFVVLTALCVPALLFVYQMGNGVSIDFSNLVWNVTAFLSLFANPFGSYDPRITFSLNSLYTLRYWQPVVTLLLMLALAPFWTTHRKHVALLVAFVVGMLLCTYGVSTLFTFKGIISHEQHEFALRLLQAIYIIPICLIPVALSRWQHHALMRTLWFVGMSVFATTSWYFSYPQFNAKFAYYSPSVSRHDVDAVHFMETDSAGNPYVVLSNQMTSAAALQEFGFAHYHALAGEEILWYAIPTGGTLYAYYLNIISSGNTEPAQELMESANVDTVYLVMYAYWPGSSQLIHQLEVQSSHIESINDRITIYKLNRYE